MGTVPEDKEVIHVRFRGRQVGAIGVSQEFSMNLIFPIGMTAEQIRLALYDHYEHMGTVHMERLASGEKLEA